MSAEDREAQEDELLALASIYTDDEFQRAMYIEGGQIKAHLELPQGFRIFVRGDDAKNPLKGEFEVCFLPPVLLTFELPADYPSASAPVFVLSCKWLTPMQVKELVADELFSRYDRLLLQSSLDSMADVVYCPRLNCQTPVLKEPGGTMGICSNCRYVFCDLCKMAYHSVTLCAQPEEKEEVTQAPQTESEEETPLSYKQIKYKKWEEKINRECIAKTCKKCPMCGVNIEKNGGCHRMYCTKCLHMFCWICNLPFTYGTQTTTNQKSAQALCTC